MTCDHPVRPGEYALCADCAYKLHVEVERLKQELVKGLPSLKALRQIDVLQDENGHLEGCLKDVDLQIGEMRRDFGSIVIRCREGDPKVDWMPTILRIAEKHNTNGECLCSEAQVNHSISITLPSNCPVHGAGGRCPRCGATRMADGAHPCNP